MFRLFWIDQNNIKQEVYSEKGIYVVYEFVEGDSLEEHIK